jgi:predicted RNA-binding Zn ribbon-like protein
MTTETAPSSPTPLASRPPAFLIADARGLDFLNTIASPEGEPVEWLADGEDLLDWLERTQLVALEEAAEARRLALPGELDAVAAEARALREWLRRFVLAHQGRALAPESLAELQPLTGLLERDESFLSIVPRSPDGGLALRWRRRWRAPASLLLPIAQAMAELVCEADFAHIKTCEGAACTLVFLDATRDHRRRWCSMAVCGNRAKQAAHRQRGRQASAERR